jgi:hypothetical protein
VWAKENVHMPRATTVGAAHITSSTKITVYIDEDADRMVHEMMEAWYPGMERVQGAVLTRAIRALYKEFQREQRRANRS